MKRPQPDIGDLLKATYIRDMGSARKFKRLWGTTTVGGVEVLIPRHYYHPSSARPANFEKLFRYLGAYKDVVSADNKGLSSAWIYLNKNKASAFPEPEDPGELSLTYHDFISHNLNQMWWDDDDGAMPSGLTLTTSIVIEAELTSGRDTSANSSSLLSAYTTKESLIAAIEANYETLWDTCLITQQGIGVINKGSFVDDVTKVETPDEDDLSPDDPWLNVVARYALRDNGIPCTIKDVEKGYSVAETGRRYTTYVVTLELPYYAFSTSSALVQDVVDDLIGSYTSRTFTKLSYPNAYYTQESIKSMDSSDLADPDVITRPYRLWEDEAIESDPVYSSLWLYSGGAWYIKADAFSNPRDYGLTYKKLFNYVMPLIDTGYKKKKVKWWKKALAFVIVTISIVFLGPAVGLVVGSLILTVASLLFSMAGMDDWATAFAEVNKTIEPLVKIASIYLMVTGLYNAYQSAQAAAEAAAQEAGKAAVEATLEQTLEQLVSNVVDDFIQNLVQGATDLLAGNITTSASMDFLTKAIKLVTMPAQLKLDDIKDRNKDLQSEYEKLKEEMSRENDVLMGFAKIYAKPATADWSIYAAEFDLPYERAGGELAMGNIQRTTKQALRKSKYDDPVFANILVV